MFFSLLYIVIMKFFIDKEIFGWFNIYYLIDEKNDFYFVYIYMYINLFIFKSNYNI